MVLIRLASLLAASTLLLGAAADADVTPTSTVVTKSITTPTTTVAAPAQVSIGCFETSTPLESHGEYKYQSPGNCQLVCLQEKKNVFAVSDGNTCWCGDKIPPKQGQVSNSSCDTDCAGTDEVKCGGPNLLWVVLTGNTLNRVEYADPVVVSSSATSSKAAATSAASQVAPSSTPSEAPEEEQSSKPNTAGIAAGVVVGIVGLGAIIGAVWFFLRRRRQMQAEEDYRRNAANVDQFVSGGKLHTSASSVNDSRIDPSFGDRRQSNGSIADNEDYSRRILKVTNV